MPLAQVIRFEERQASRSRPAAETPFACVILKFTRFPDSAQRAMTSAYDDDRAAGRGRDPG